MRSWVHSIVGDGLFATADVEDVADEGAEMILS